MPRSTDSFKSNKLSRQSSVSSVIPRPPSTSMPSVPTMPHPLVPTNPPVIVAKPPGLWDSVKQGFGFGAGSAIANNLFRATPVQAQTPPSSVGPVGASSTQDATGTIQYVQCVKEGGTHDACKHHLS